MTQIPEVCALCFRIDCDDTRKHAIRQANIQGDQSLQHNLRPGCQRRSPSTVLDTSHHLLKVVLVRRAHGKASRGLVGHHVCGIPTMSDDAVCAHVGFHVLAQRVDAGICKENASRAFPLVPTLLGGFLAHHVSVHPVEQGFVLCPAGWQAPQYGTHVKLVGQAYHLHYAAIDSQHREKLL